MVRLSNRISHQFFFLVMFDTTILNGLLIAVSFTLESFWSRVVYLGYPLDLLLLATMLCSLGQYLVDSVSGSSFHLDSSYSRVFQS